jgi:hypothetical protein
MAKFLFLLRDDPAPFLAFSPAEMEAAIGEYRAWAQGLADRLLGSDKLTDEPGRIVVSDGKSIQVKDGPYAETKELIGGYFLVQARDYDEAVALARTCPQVKHIGSIEVRQIQER